MPKYHLTNLAIKDLADIWNYTFDYWSEEQADYYYGQLIDSFSEIAEKYPMQLGMGFTQKNGVTPLL